MGAPMGNRNAAGPHNKYSGSKSQHNLVFKHGLNTYKSGKPRLVPMKYIKRLKGNNAKRTKVFSTIKTYLSGWDRGLQRAMKKY